MLLYILIIISFVFAAPTSAGQSFSLPSSISEPQGNIQCWVSSYEFDPLSSHISDPVYRYCEYQVRLRRGGQFEHQSKGYDYNPQTDGWIDKKFEEPTRQFVLLKLESCSHGFRNRN